jgi:beta-lactamase class A
VLALGADGHDGWGGPRAVSVVPGQEPSRHQRSIEVRFAPRPTARPPWDPPTVPLSPAAGFSEQPTVPRTELPGPAPSEPVPPPIRPRPAAPRRRSTGRGRAVLLALVLGLVVATASNDVGPLHEPAPPLASSSPGATAPPRAPEVDPVLAARTATAAIDRLVQGSSAGHVSVAAVDTATGRSFGYAADNPVPTASVVKLDILETLLLQSQDDGRPPSAEARELATVMIQQSDNDAASRLWEDLGGVPVLDAANRRLGVRSTHLVDHWGSSTTTASDRLALLAALHTPGPLDPDSRAYALDLMTNVVDEQRWGVSAAADPGTTTALKNGWTPVDSDDGRWVVGSVGIVTAAGRPVLLAVLTEHQPSKDAGIRLVETLSRIAARAVTLQAPPTAPR